MHASTPARPSILIVSYPGEEHADAVAALLKGDGRCVARINLADFPARAGLSSSWRPDRAPSFMLETEDGPIDLADVKVVWWRRVQPFAVDSRIGASARRQFAVSETSQALLGMLESLPCRWVNPREADANAHHKPYQWTVAQSVGLQVPRTLVTNQPSAAHDFISMLAPARVVFKAFLASIEEWRETRLVERDDMARLDLVRYAPVIFQEYVEGVDLRITIIGQAIFTAEIDARRSSYPVDMRMVISEGKVRPIELPEDVRSRLLALQRRLGLVYGAVDMRRTEEGQYFFLEVNPAGQWLFAEQRTGLPISRSHADLLASLADGREV
jgi:glutathione synthase/RimK-type ligase-like ATP-grasp enzyme